MRFMLQRLKKAISLVVAVSLVLLAAGCAGRTPTPVAQYQYGDEKKSCAHLRSEISEIENDIKTKANACDNTDGSNVALGVVGAIIFWPALFFMDLSEADKIELEALRKRHNALVRLCADKNCGFGLKEIANARPNEAKNTDDK